MDPLIGIEKRKDVLLQALYIESLISRFLGGLLGIEDSKKSISLGNKSSALSFSQKVNLLIDIGALKAENKNKFIAFMEIRNQFIHNFDAYNYEACLSSTNQEKFILKTFPQKTTLSKEKQLENAVSELMDNVLKLTASIMEKIDEKILKEVEHSTYKNSFEILNKSVGKASEVCDRLAENMKIKNETLSAEELKKVGKTIITAISQDAKKQLVKNKA